ncbi:CDC48 family AAA ATPase [Methanogenium sp. MK-MG]|uniref:CDC48 family AAA ATPase n=1 Tax=Methanogenium sp. MK-MG TaxID=2599926 RepID=UPI0013EBA3CD|nr:CDC48 family AAA ATPase [Methanogenium sp. MK-MG]KAF1078237.1 VCP-like ATPase [Methanogenium sp. MK-MG]
MLLNVESAYPEDRGLGRCRLDPATMNALRLVPGDLVWLTGSRTTVAKVWRMLADDWDQENVKIDNFTRSNAGVSSGDKIEVVKVETETNASRIILAPPEDLSNQPPINFNQAMLRLLGYPVTKGDTVPVLAGLPFMQQQLIPFRLVTVEPEDAVIITKDTIIEFSDKSASGIDGFGDISYEDVGGLKNELKNVRETIELPMRHPELFRKLGIEPPKGVLLYGPPGTGKTLIAKAVANESGAHFISIAGPEVLSKYYGETEQRLREIFEEADSNAPSVIFIDELDSIAPRREDVTGEVERRMVAQLLTMMDGLEERGQVLVIGATNRLEAIDPALRRPGRFDREIEIGVPDETGRLEILKIHTCGMPLEGEVRRISLEETLDAAPDESREEAENRYKLAVEEIESQRERLLQNLASRTHGFVGADVQSLAREAAMRALRRYLPEIDLENDEISLELLKKMEVTSRDFADALREVSPSAMREVLIEVPHVTWHDIGGAEREIEEVREAVEYPLTRPDRFLNLGIDPPNGVLLYGPPGTGKTLIAKAVAHESGANFIPVRGPQLLSKWVGESERAVREIFRRARQVAPSIIFFDELDAIAPARSGQDSHVIESVVNQILTEFDGLEDMTGVVVMGATNRPDIIDPALMRAGRFDRLVAVHEPDAKGRLQILSIHSRSIPIENSALEALVTGTASYDEGGIEVLFGTAAEAYRKEKDDMVKVTADDILATEIADTNVSDEILSTGRRRRAVARMIEEHRIQLEDPERDSLLREIAGKAQNYVGSDLDLLCREAAMFAMRDGAAAVGLQHFEKALLKVRPMMNERVREQYDRIQQYFKGGLPQQMQVHLPEYQ